MIKLLRDKAPFLVYIAGGVLSAAVDIGTMQLLLLNGMPTLPAVTAAFAAGLLVNYAFHARVTFDQQGSRASFARYLCVVALNYTLTIAIVTTVEHLTGSALAGKLLSLPAVSVVGYVLGKLWIFK